MMNIPWRLRARGLSLIELLVALAISMVIVVAAASFFLTTSRTRDTQEAAGTLQDNARFATEMIAKSIQQSGYQSYVWSTAGAAGRREVLPATDDQPDLRGYNNSAAGSNTDFTSSSWGHNKSSNRINNSDVLVVRYQGSGTGSADGSMIDCLGRPQPEPVVAGDRAYSIFEIRQSTGSSEPELRCKYVGSGGTLTSEPIVRGVESLQILYGIDTNGDSLVDRWQNAEEVDSSCGGAACIAKWQAVRSVRVGMVMRSSAGAASTTASGTVTLSPLSANFSQGVNDTLVVNQGDGRLRRVVTFTVNLRNAL